MTMTSDESGASMDQVDDAYVRWVRDAVQASIDDRRPSVDNGTVKAEFAERRAALAARVGS